MSDADIQRSLGRIESSLGELLRRANEKDEADDALEIRVGSLEESRTFFKGSLALISGLSAAALAIFKAFK
jgi:hypothetical protein